MSAAGVVVAVLIAATPSPSPSPTRVDAELVTPGVPGFLITLAVVLACIPLFLSMTSKVRRVQYRGRLAEEAAAAEASPADPGVGGGAPDGGSSEGRQAPGRGPGG